MVIKKIGIVTGSPYVSNFAGKILLIDTKDRHWVLTTSEIVNQSNPAGTGYRQATIDEIKDNWSLIHPYWEPQLGDKVIVTQNYHSWQNEEGLINSQHPSEDYWNVNRISDDSLSHFDKTCQMILDPNHGWNIEKELSTYDKLKPEVQAELDLIDPELKKEILEAIDSQPYNGYFTQDNLSEVIVLFRWRDTKQEENYWVKIYDHLSRSNLKVYCKLKKEVRQELSQINSVVSKRILEMLHDQFGFKSKESIFSYTKLSNVVVRLVWDDTIEKYHYWADVHGKLFASKYSEIVDFETLNKNKEKQINLDKNVSDCTTDEIYEVISDVVKEELTKIHSVVKDDILYNIKHYPYELKTLKSVSECLELSRLIGDGFIWHGSSQGLNYWSDMFKYVNAKQYSKIIPHYLAKKESSVVKVTDDSSDNSSNDSANSYIPTHGTNFEYKIDNFVIRGPSSLIDDLLKCPLDFTKELINHFKYSSKKSGELTFISETLLELLKYTIFPSNKNIEYWTDMIELVKEKKYLSLCSKEAYYLPKPPTTSNSEVIILNKPNKSNYLSVDASNYDQKPLKIKQKPKVKLN